MTKRTCARCAQDNYQRCWNCTEGNRWREKAPESPATYAHLYDGSILGARVYPTRADAEAAAEVVRREWKHRVVEIKRLV